MLRNGYRLLSTHPRLAAACVKAGCTLDFDVFVAEGRRSLLRSAVLYEQGRTKPGEVVTNAKPGESPHNFGLAVDLYPATLEGKFDPQGNHGTRFEELAKVMQSIPDVVWGGTFKSLTDKPHFELKDWQLKKDWSITATIAGIALFALAFHVL